MISIHANRASAGPRCRQQAQRALIVLQQLRHKTNLQNLIDQVINVGLISLVGGSIAAALAIGAPMSAAGSQTAMPTAEWRSLDQRVLRASSHQQHMQRLVGTVNAPVGQGWG